MGEADDKHNLDWLLPHELQRRIADASAELLKPLAWDSVVDHFRHGDLPYQYRDSAGRMHRNDLADDFRREATPFPDGTVTRPARIIKRPLVRYSPLGWTSPFGDDHSSPRFIENHVPAETLTDFRFGVPKQHVPAAVIAEPAIEPAPADAQPQRRSRKRRNQGAGPQRRRARVVLKRMYGEEEKYPTREEVSDADLLDGFAKEYKRVEGKTNPPSKHPIPSPDTVLREVGRRD